MQIELKLNSILTWCEIDLNSNFKKYAMKALSFYLTQQKYVLCNSTR